MDSGIEQTQPGRKREPRVVVLAPPEATAVEADNVVRAELATILFGFKPRAIEGMIHRGDWLEGRQYHRDPLGGVWVDRKAVRKWVLGESR